MSKLMVLGITLMLLLVSLPLISIGTMQDTPWMWWTGLILLAVSGLVPPITRYAMAKDEDGEDDEAKDEDEEEAQGDEGEGEDERERTREAHRDDRGREQPTDDPAELEARAHEERAAAHRERARAHEELAAADERRAAAQERERKRKGREPGNGTRRGPK